MHSLNPREDNLSNRAVYTTKNELWSFLRFLDKNPVIQEFFQHDTYFHLADKYLIAMVFIYFKRAQLGPEDYTYLNFFAGLCLAHSMEEDVELSSKIYPWALGNGLKDELPRLLELKTLLWVAMDYRAAVSQYCCKQLISISADHPVWQRERSPVHMTYLFSASIENDLRNATSKKKTESKRTSKKALAVEKTSLITTFYKKK